jgi:hypothetical protein
MGNTNQLGGAIIMPIYASLTALYAKAIYIDGSKRFPDIRQEYVPYVKQYAATNYTLEQIDNALAQTWITQAEYDDTLALRV